MRLRPKFPVPQAFTATVWTILLALKLWAISHRGWTSNDGWWMLPVVGLIVMFGWQAVQSLSTTWEFGSDALLEYRPGGDRAIPYKEIVSVSRKRLGTGSGPFLEVEYGTLGSVFEPRTTASMNPVQTEFFVKELRDRAPQAVFSV